MRPYGTEWCGFSRVARAQVSGLSVTQAQTGLRLHLTIVESTYVP